MWRPPIPFGESIGDTFKIIYNLPSLIDEMPYFFHHRQLSGLILIKYHWIFIEVYWEDVFFMHLQEKNEQCERVGYKLF